MKIGAIFCLWLALAAPSWVAYPSVDGALVPALVWRPAVQNGAGVVFAHGDQGGTANTQATDQIAQDLADRGYWVVAPDYRGSSGHGAAWLNAYDLGGLEVEDVALAVVWLAERGIARVIVAGVSHGGLIAGGVAFRYPILAAGYALVSSGGDWEVIYALAPPRLQRQLERSMGGTPEEASEEYRVRSLLWQAEAVARPLLIQHGMDDPIVPVELSVELAQALTEPTVFFYPGNGHGVWWSNPVAWQDFLEWLVDVFS